MQVLNSLRSAKQRHPDCQIVKRKGRLYVICKSNPRFKAVQGRKKKGLDARFSPAFQGSFLFAIGSKIVGGKPAFKGARQRWPLFVEN